MTKRPTHRTRSPLSLIAGCLLTAGLAADTQATRIAVGSFSENSLDGWETETFSGTTVYRLAQTPGGDATALHAQVQASASGLYRKVHIDLKRTPWLNWSWRADNIYSGLDETRKEGDDYPARIYLVKSGGLLFWNTKALNYVWSSSQPTGSHWPNAFTDHAQLLAVESGPEHLGEWRHYRRNVRADWERLFGESIESIDALALMSDGDNAGGNASAWYGDIWFSP